MKRNMKIFSNTLYVAAMVCFVWSLVSAVPCSGAGYGIYEWGARGNALGGAMVARADDPSALAYNPAGITQLPGDQFMVGITAIMPDIDINFRNAPAGSVDGRGKDNIWPIPNAFYTHQINETYWVGFGIYSRVGLGTEVKNEEQFAGRYNCSRAGIESLSFNPNLAVKITDELSVAVGAEAVWLDFSYNKFTDVDGNPATATDIKQEISADGWKYGFNLALHYKPEDWLSIGASFRNEISMGVDGEADFTRSSGAEAALAAMKASLVPAVKQMGTFLDAALRDTGVGGTEPIPQLVSVGVMFTPVDRLSVEVDAVHTKWSSYKQLTMEYDNILGDRSSRKNWEDTWRFQIGLEYAFSDRLDLMAGYVFDESPIVDEYVDYAVPANDRQIYSLGARLHTGRWTFDVSYSYLTVKDRDVSARPAEGVLDSKFENGNSHMIGFGVACAF